MKIFICKYVKLLKAANLYNAIFEKHREIKVGSTPSVDSKLQHGKVNDRVKNSNTVTDDTDFCSCTAEYLTLSP